jgi:hypothetical protein
MRLPRIAWMLFAFVCHLLIGLAVSVPLPDADSVLSLYNAVYLNFTNVPQPDVLPCLSALFECAHPHSQISVLL